MKKLAIALIQMLVEDDKAANLSRAGDCIREAAARGAQLVVLPEFFNSPYNMKQVARYAEPADGPTNRFLAEQAAKYRLIMVGGSIPECDAPNRFYNSCFVYGPDGQLLGRHRKMHLFDIDMPGRIQFRESDYLQAGNQLTVIDFAGFCFSVQICFDVRFPEIARLAAIQGAQLLIIPAAFNTTTGPLHWELAMRSRAVDNQLFVAACSPALNPAAAYHAWGHSLVADPMGQIIARLDAGEGLLYAELDLSSTEETRRSLPIMHRRRSDLYRVDWRGPE